MKCRLVPVCFICEVIMFDKVLKCIEILNVDFITAARIREAAVEMFMNAKATNKSQLLLLINSKGGESLAMETICELVFLNKLRLTTFAVGDCQSAAVPIFAAGEAGWRVALRSAKFLVHAPRVWCNQSGSLEDFERATLAYLERSRQHHLYQYEWLGRNTERDTAFWKAKMTKEGTSFSADEAKEWGLVDYVADDLSDGLDYLKQADA